MDKDEAFQPIRGETYQESRMTNLILWAPGFVWFYYLLCGYSPRHVSHFNPVIIYFYEIEKDIDYTVHCFFSISSSN